MNGCLYRKSRKGYGRLLKTGAMVSPMPRYQHHVFVCTNKRPPGHPKGSCGERGAQDIVLTLTEEVERQELFETVKVNSSSCLGPCQQGPTIVVYPEGIWYCGVNEKDIQELVTSHLVNGVPVDRLVLSEQG
jgi:(2Fe-2S) ferredoxin